MTELEDLLNSNLLKRQQELTKRLQQADVEADRSGYCSMLCLHNSMLKPIVLHHVASHVCCSNT